MALVTLSLANKVLKVRQTNNKPLTDIENNLFKVGSPNEYLLD